MIHSEKVSWDSVDDVIKLRINKEQKGFVAPNRDSIIDAYFAMTGKYSHLGFILIINP